jgi:hypothetical protein
MAVRCMLIYDRQVNGAFPNLADIFASANATGTGYANSGVNMTNRGRFMILADQTETIDPAGGVSKAVKLFRTCALESEYKANSGTIGDLSTGAIYFAIWSGSAGPNSSYLSDFSCRIRYLD